MGGRTRFEYDVRGRLVRIIDPLGGATTRTYSATDLVDSVTDPDGHITTWTYDAAGREASTTVDGKLISSISRDLLRRRVVISDYTGSPSSVSLALTGADG